MRILEGRQTAGFLRLRPLAFALGGLLIGAAMSASSFADTQGQADKNIIDFAASQKKVETVPAPQQAATATPHAAEKPVEQTAAATQVSGEQDVVAKPVQMPIVAPHSNNGASKQNTEAQSVGNNSNGKAPTESMTPNLVLAGVAALLAIFVCRATITIGWDYAVFVPTMAFVSLVASFFVVGGDSPIWRYFLAAYGLAAGELATIYARNRIMGWFANSTFVYIGNNSRDVFWKKIGHRFGIEALAVALGLGLGWCGGFLLGLVELKKLKSKTREAQSQNA